MKALKWIFPSLALIVASYFLFDWWTNRNYYEHGKNGTYTINIGKTFQIQLDENGSTGYHNCWINSARARCIELADEDYEGDIMSKLGNVGSGGRIIFEFKGIKKGVDTIAIAYCPTGVEQKDCSQYSTDSVTAADNLFIVNVK